MTLSCLGSFQSFVPFMLWNTMDICFGSEVLNIDNVRVFYSFVSPGWPDSCLHKSIKVIIQTDIMLNNTLPVSQFLRTFFWSLLNIKSHLAIASFIIFLMLKNNQLHQRKQSLCSFRNICPCFSNHIKHKPSNAGEEPRESTQSIRKQPIKQTISIQHGGVMHYCRSTNKLKTMNL